MKKKIFTAIMDDMRFDGNYYEKFLNNPITIDNNKEIVRVIIVEDDVMVHILDKNDETEFVSFDNLVIDVQTKIYADIFHYKIFTKEEYFDFLKNYLDDGDVLKVENDNENLFDEGGNVNYVYVLSNRSGDVISKYYTFNKLYKKF